ncbi:MAG TPA: kelch repeat-containing protein [Pseudobacteroides sp.]|nr:kelch repeat-containing protein [Pseudobacteroides sp.]
MKLNKLMASVLSVSLLLSTASFDVGASSQKGYQKNKHKIHLRAATFDSDDSSIGAKYDFNKSGKEARPYIISFTGPITEEMKEKVINAGAVLLDYIPDFSFLTFTTPNIAQKVKNVDCVENVIPYEDEFKLDPDLLEKINNNAKKGLDDEVKIRISTFDTDLSSLDNDLKNIGSKKLSSKKGVITAKAKFKNIKSLLKNNSIKYIEEEVEAEVNNDIARGITGSESISNLPYEGSGQIIGIADTGLDKGNEGLANNTIHRDFLGRIDKIFDHTGENGADANGHGTHTAGSIIGDGSMSDGQIKGTAPKAHLVVQDVAVGSTVRFSSISDLLQEAYAYGARIHSNSWGSPVKGAYTSNSNEVDNFIWNNPDMVVLFSAGNNGRKDSPNLGSPGSAKNCITVGASENFRPYMPIDDNLLNSDNPSERAIFSSYGCADGRIKPDVVAPGTNIASAKTSLSDTDNPYPGNPYYQYMSGTSMSTPLTAGNVAVIREYIEKNYGITSPTAALVKAFLINGALTEGYTAEQGWGKTSIYDSLLATKIIEDNATLATGQTASYTTECKVTSTDKPLKITLTWSDYPGSVSASKALVNDLNLKVTAPDGTVYNGNDFTAPFNSEVDNKNNVENITIRNPKVGTYKIEVIGYNVPKGPQPFALVYSADFFSTPKNLRADATYNSINVSWDSVPGATGYDLMIDGTNIISLTNTTYTHNNLVYNTKHTYKVRAKNSSKTGDWSNTLSMYTALYSPDVTSKALNDEVQLSWYPINKATSYDVILDGVFMENITDTSFSLRTTESKSEYNFNIRARTDFNSSLSNPVSVTTLDCGVSYKAQMNEARAFFSAAADQDGKIYVFGGKKGPFYIKIVEQYDPTSNSWVNKAPMSSSRIETTAVLGDNGKIYVIGGFDGSNCLSTVEEYDPATDTWTSKASMPTARCRAGAVNVNGKIYVIGGFNGNSAVDKVEIYDPSTNEWSEGASMPTARSNFGISKLNNKIIVLGGKNGESVLKSFEEYDPTLDSWTIKKSLSNADSDFTVSEINGKLYFAGGQASNKVVEYDDTIGLYTQRSELPSKLIGHTSVVINEKLYILGGYGEGSYLSDVTIYNPKEGIWKKNTDMNHLRSYFSSTVLDGKIYAIGGIGGVNLGLGGLDSVESYDPANDTWTLEPKMSVPRVDASAVSLNGKIYVMGGFDDLLSRSTFYDSMEEYDPATKTWSLKAKMPEMRCSHEAVALNGYIYVIGGSKVVYNSATGQYKMESTDKVLRYDPSTNKWSTAGSISIPRRDFGAEVANGKIYIMGGYDASDKLTTSIEEYDPSKDTWTTKNPMPVASAHFGTATANDKIYIIGGTGNNRSFKEYDPVTETWTDKGGYPFAGERHKAEIVDNRIYTMGGLYYKDLPLAIDCVYSTDAFATELSIGSGIMEPKSGKKVIPVTISNVPAEGIYKVNAVVQYDKNKLSVTNATAGSIIPNGYGFTYSVDSSKGEVTLTFTGDKTSQKIINTNGVMANIEFDVIDTVSTISNTPLTLVQNKCKLYKSDSYQYQSTKLNNGSIDIFIYGDVDGSSTVTKEDYDLVKAIILSNSKIFPHEYGRLAADVDGNGQIDSIDMMYILRYANGTITQFPVQI